MIPNNLPHNPKNSPISTPWRLPRSLFRVFAVAIAWLATTGSAIAATFTFDVGNTTGGTVGTRQTDLQITVDPGTGGLVNRTFFATDITGLHFTLTNLLGQTTEFGVCLTGCPTEAVANTRSGPLSFITTDATGRGTLSLVTLGDRSVVEFRPSAPQGVFARVQISQGGFLNSAGRLFEEVSMGGRFGNNFDFSINPSTDVSFLSRESYPATGAGSGQPNIIPLPATVWMFLAAFGLLGSAARRRSA